MNIYACTYIRVKSVVKNARKNIRIGTAANYNYYCFNEETQIRCIVVAAAAAQLKGLLRFFS